MASSLAPSWPSSRSIFWFRLSNTSALHLPLATPGWLETTTARKPKRLISATACAAPGINRNSSTLYGESPLPSSPFQRAALMTPSRSRKTTLRIRFFHDAQLQAQAYEVVQRHVHGLHQRGAQRLPVHRPHHAHVGQLRQGAAAESGEAEDLSPAT